MQTGQVCPAAGQTSVRKSLFAAFSAALTQAVWQVGQPPGGSWSVLQQPDTPMGSVRLLTPPPQSDQQPTGVASHPLRGRWTLGPVEEGDETVHSSQQKIRVVLGQPEPEPEPEPAADDGSGSDDSLVE
eukprot:COSAG04_NODE_5700_length_1521_cov_1.080169_2_plen_129_part_00